MDPAKSPRGSASPEDLPAFVEHDADRTVVWLWGEHDASTVDGLWAVTAKAIALGDGDVVVDLSGVEFMGTATVSVINRAREALRARSRSLTLRSPSRCAKRALDLFGQVEQLRAHSAG